jgi:hypothetical protein
VETTPRRPAEVSLAAATAAFVALVDATYFVLGLIRDLVAHQTIAGVLFEIRLDLEFGGIHLFNLGAGWVRVSNVLGLCWALVCAGSAGVLGLARRPRGLARGARNLLVGSCVLSVLCSLWYLLGLNRLLAEHTVPVISEIVLPAVFFGVVLPAGILLLLWLPRSRSWSEPDPAAEPVAHGRPSGLWVAGALAMAIGLFGLVVGSIYIVTGVDGMSSPYRDEDDLSGLILYIGLLTAPPAAAMVVAAVFTLARHDWARVLLTGCALVELALLGWIGSLWIGNAIAVVVALVLVSVLLPPLWLPSAKAWFAKASATPEQEPASQ